MMSCNIAVIGAGPAGCICAYFVQQNNQVTLFDFKSPLHTLLYTGGGRCNLAYAEYDFKELAKNYPRGEKFLYSIFSKFYTPDTVDFFENIGISTYTQDDLRIFPTSNSAQDVRKKMLNKLKKCAFKKEKVVDVVPPTLALPLKGGGESDYSPLEGESKSPISEGGEEVNVFKIITESNVYYFDKVIIAVGGHAGFELAEGLGHKIVEPKPALVGLVSKENFKSVQGLSLKNITASVVASEAKQSKLTITDDMIFTHEGISGPLAYKISSICARVDYDKKNPLLIKLNFVGKNLDLQSLLNSNPKKDIKNLLSELVPKSLSEYLIVNQSLSPETKCHQIDGKTRDLIVKALSEFEINVVSPAKEGEVVTSGGVCLDEINPKTMESKLVEGLYFAGEAIDVDGFCGGFNLQNCWSTGFVAGNSV